MSHIAQTPTEARLDAALAALDSMDPGEANLVITRLLLQLSDERTGGGTPEPSTRVPRAAQTRRLAHDRGWNCTVAEPAAKAAVGVS